MKNSKLPNPGFLALNCLLGVLLSSTASASHDEPGNIYYAYGEVLDAQPIIRHTSVRIPQSECHTAVNENTVDRPPRNKILPTLFGGLLGGVIGHQFGGGNGKKALTIAGAFAGASIANNSSHRQYRFRPSHQSRERCTVVHEIRDIEKIEGYQVTYLYKGRQFTRTMDEHPGSTVRIRVQVEPVNNAYASTYTLSSKKHF